MPEDIPLKKLVHPQAALTDTRRRILAELEKPDIPQDQRTALLLKLSDLQLMSAKKWARRRKNMQKRPSTGRKRGRQKRMHDSQGNPLYNDSPKLVKPEDADSKQKFLSGIQSNGPSETENT